MPHLSPEQFRIIISKANNRNFCKQWLNSNSIATFYKIGVEIPFFKLAIVKRNENNYSKIIAKCICWKTEINRTKQKRNYYCLLNRVRCANHIIANWRWLLFNRAKCHNCMNLYIFFSLFLYDSNNKEMVLSPNASDKLLNMWRLLAWTFHFSYSLNIIFHSNCTRINASVHNILGVCSCAKCKCILWN